MLNKLFRNMLLLCFSTEFHIFITVHTKLALLRLSSTPSDRWNYCILMVFSFLPNNVHFILKNAISCLFLKNVSPSKRVICFILNNLHFPMVEDIGFYALHKSRVLIIPCKADGFCLFIGGYQMKFKNVAWYRYPL